MKKIIAGLCLMPFITHAAIYQGHIGTSPIILEIPSPLATDINDEPSGVYFYQNRLVDIPLVVETNNHGFTLKTIEKPWSNVSSLETFTLTSQGNKIVGDWRTANGKSQAVELSLMPDGKSMDDVKTKYLMFKTIKSENMFGEKINWVKETHSNIIFPRLTQNSDNVINQVLFKSHYEITMDSMENCSVGQDTKVAFVSKNLLSLDVIFSDNCPGAAHPNVSFSGHLFNRQTGLEYELADVIEFQKNAPKEDKNELSTTPAYNEYMEKVFAPKLQKLIAAQHYTPTSEKIDKELMSECSYDDASNWNAPSWVYTDKGIEFTPYYSHAGTVCRNPFLVKWKALKPYLNPKFAYFKH